MYPRNAASPERICIGAVVQISDGAPQGSGVTITVRGQGGSEASGGGTTAYGATGVVVYYTPTQAETDFTSFVVIASKSGCIPVAQTIITTASSVPGRTMPADGSVTAAVIANGAIDAATFAADVDAEILSYLTDDATRLDGSAINAIVADWTNGGRLDLILDIIAADTTTDIPALIGTPATSLSAMLTVIDDFLDTEIGAIKAKTDALPTDPADASDVAAAIAALNDLSAAEVNAEVVDALAVDTYAEPTGVPAATLALSAKIGWLFMGLRNGLTVTASKKQFLNDGGTAEWEKDLSDDGTTYAETKGNAP